MNNTTLSKIFGLDLEIIYHFLDREEQWFSISEISRDLELNKMTARRSLEKILKAGLIMEKDDGYRRSFKLKNTPLIPTLRVLKNVDSTLIKRVIRDLKKKVDILLLYGSRADGTNLPDSDWDLLVVSDDIDPIIINKLSNQLENRFGQEVNLHLYKRAEVVSMRNENSPFWMEISKKKVPLVGDIDDL